MKAKTQQAFADLEERDRRALEAPLDKTGHLGWWCRVLHPPHQFVYVIGSEGSKAIKVGVATDFEARRESLQCGNPRKLNLLHIFPAGYDLEARIHRRLAKSRIHGEWFEGPMVEQTLAELDELARKMVDAYDGSGNPPSWKGRVTWLGERHHTKTRRKPADVTVRHVDPDTLR